ncbi:MAG: hypothetical protein K6T75_11615 [Acetobacteraceae bacterium]|nr:hypothetical protein [Acetobacteraceae bacterium]
MGQGRARREIEGLMAYLADNREGIAGLPARGIAPPAAAVGSDAEGPWRIGMPVLHGPHAGRP